MSEAIVVKFYSKRSEELVCGKLSATLEFDKN